MDISVTLTDIELAQAKRLLDAKDAASAQEGLVDQMFSKDPEDPVRGYRGQAAAAKALGMKVNPIFSGQYGSFRIFSENVADVGEFEVKTTKYNTGKLLIRGHHQSDRKYILVIADDMYNYRLVGWTYGYKVLFNPKFEWLGNTWAMPQQYLNSMETLHEG